MSSEKITLIGYSGHAYVVIEIFKSMGRQVNAYCDFEEKTSNPYLLKYVGREDSPASLPYFKDHSWFIAIGNNQIRRRAYQRMVAKGQEKMATAIHSSAVIAEKTQIQHGSMIGPQVAVNALAEIGVGVICNTGSIIEHECRIGDFAHIAPGAVLAGNVSVGENSFVGANAVVREGVNIGKNVIIGAGSVVIKDLPDNVTVVGNPQRIIKS